MIVPGVKFSGRDEWLIRSSRSHRPKGVTRQAGARRPHRLVLVLNTGFHFYMAYWRLLTQQQHRRAYISRSQACRMAIALPIHREYVHSHKLPSAAQKIARWVNMLYRFLLQEN